GGAAGGVGAPGGMLSPAAGIPPPPAGAARAAGSAAGGGGLLAGAGGMIGGLVGGPVGSMVGQMVGGTVEAVARAAAPAPAAPAKLASAGLPGMAHSLRELQGPLGPVGLGLDALGTGLETVSNAIKGIPIVGSLLGPLTDVLAGIPGTIKDITTSLVGMAAV